MEKIDPQIEQISQIIRREKTLSREAKIARTGVIFSLAS